MTAKLDRLPICEEIKVWDLSLLSPEDQDRANDLMDLIQGSTDIEAEGVKAAINEFENMVDGLPLLGENDRRQGPKIEVPRSLAYYWRWRQNASEWRNYSFDKLSGSGSRIAPIDEWETDDREELTELLDIAASEPY